MYVEPWVKIRDAPTPVNGVTWRTSTEPADIYNTGELLLRMEGGATVSTENVPRFWYLTLRSAVQDANPSLVGALAAAAQGEAFGDTDHYQMASEVADIIDARYEVSPVSLVAAADSCSRALRENDPTAVGAGAVSLAYEYGRSCPAKPVRLVYNQVGDETVEEGVRTLEQCLTRSLLLSCCQARTFPKGTVRVGEF